MALQRRSFKTELLEALRRTAEGRFEDLRYSPGWLNPADFEELARSVGLRTVPQQLENVQGLYAFLRFMGAREATMEDLATGLEISTPSSLGAAEVVSQITKLHPTKQIGTSEIDSHWRLWPVDGRSVPLNESAAAALRSHKARQNQERIAAREWHDGELVFPNRLGKPMDPTNLYSQEYKPLLKRAGLAEQGFTFHALRHTFATALFSRDVHPKKVQSLLGHSSITQTMDTYSHLIGDIGGDAIAGLDEAFGYS